MNAHIAKALLRDALYQVLDNRVFRLLVIMAICLIAPTFLIAFKPDGLDVLFGWEKVRYDDIFLFAHLRASGSQEIHVLAIQFLQDLFVQNLAGSFGIMLALAATAFFVPRMLEKGEADILFSKPVGRFLLLLARYGSGVLFVGVLSFVLVLGMHLGFLLRSGYSDPAFLWSVLTLVYVFALIHAFSTLAGVLTRSAMAGLLAAILFFGFNGCVHWVWMGKEYGIAIARHQAESNDDAEARRDLDDLDNPLVRTLQTTVDVAHFVLPKTRDAAVLTNQLRRAVSAPEFVLEDRGGSASFTRDPVGFERASSERAVDLGAAPVVWSGADPPSNEARISIARHSRLVERAGTGKSKATRTSDTRAANDFLKSLEDRADLEGKPELVRETAGRTVRVIVRWTEKRDGQPVHRARAFYASGDWMYEIDLEHPATWRTREDAHAKLREFLTGVTPRRLTPLELDPDEWYAQQIGWNAPPRYNAGISIGSSILFGLVMLLIARWKLSRIDF